MKILAISGSLQAGSSNLALLERAAELAPPGTVVEFFDGVRALPPFDTDLEAHGSPPSVAAFRDAGVRVMVADITEAPAGMLSDSVGYQRCDLRDRKSVV